VRELKKEGSIRFAGLGIFRKRKLKARVGGNPATGEQIKIPARTRLRFTPAKALKDSVPLEEIISPPGVGVSGLK
jgi:DNA-binding protein HU-beta